MDRSIETLRSDLLEIERQLTLLFCDPDLHCPLLMSKLTEIARRDGPRSIFLLLGASALQIAADHEFDAFNLSVRGAEDCSVTIDSLAEWAESETVKLMAKVPPNAPSADSFVLGDDFVDTAIHALLVWTER